MRDHYGNTCLHLVILNGRHPSQREFKETLMLLVQAGADIHAVDGYDRSVSELAFHAQRWDLWEAVLRDCGVDISQISVELREKGDPLPNDSDSEGYECEDACCTSDWSEDGRFSEEEDFQHEIDQPEARNQIDDFQDGSGSDSDCSMGGAQLSF